VRESGFKVGFISFLLSCVFGFADHIQVRRSGAIMPAESPMTSTDKLKPGLKALRAGRGEEHTAPRVGSGRVHVLATPVMINVIERRRSPRSNTCCRSHQSLGTRLDIRHFAATPVGMRVRAEVEVVKWKAVRSPSPLR